MCFINYESFMKTLQIICDLELERLAKAFVMWCGELNWVKLYGEFQESRWMSHCLERIFAYFWIYMIIRENHEWNQNQADYINSNGWLILIRWS